MTLPRDEAPVRVPRLPGTPLRAALVALATDPRLVSRARHTVSRLLRLWSLTADVRDTAALVTGELATNAVLHAPGSASVTVLFSVRRHLHIEVTDGGGDLPVLRSPADSGHEHGHGLTLVAALSTEWGTTVHNDGGKSVWASLPLPLDLPA